MILSIKNRNSKALSELRAGDVFLYNDLYYLKTSEYGKVVRLANGIMKDVNSFARVYPIAGKFVED